jgi:hypothetical protein
VGLAASVKVFAEVPTLTGFAYGHGHAYGIKFANTGTAPSSLTGRATGIGQAAAEESPFARKRALRSALS